MNQSENEGTTPETFKNKRGRKSTANHIREVKLWIHDDVICGGIPLDKDSQEYAIKMDEMKRILTAFCYDNRHLFMSGQNTIKTMSGQNTVKTMSGTTNQTNL